MERVTTKQKEYWNNHPIQQELRVVTTGRHKGEAIVVYFRQKTRDNLAKLMIAINTVYLARKESKSQSPEEIKISDPLLKDLIVKYFNCEKSYTYDKVIRYLWMLQALNFILLGKIRSRTHAGNKSSVLFVVVKQQLTAFVSRVLEYKKSREE